MDLATYLEANKLSPKKAALDLGCSRNTLWRMRRRWQRPHPELATRIIAWSGGQVTLGELMDVLPDRPRRGGPQPSQEASR